MDIQLSEKEIQSFCDNTILSFETQFQTIDPLDTERARLKLYGLRQQLHALRWVAKDFEKKIGARPLDYKSLYPLEVLELTLCKLGESLDIAELDIDRYDPSNDKFFCIDAMRRATR